MGKGFIAGQVITPEGRYAKGAYVKLVQVVSGTNQIDVSQAGYAPGKGDAYAGSDGSFAIPFTWSGSEFANFQDTTEIDGTYSPVTLFLVAYTEKNASHTSSLTASGTIHGNGYLMKDIWGTGGLSTAPFDSIPDLLDFGIGLIDAYRKLKSHPIFKSEVITTEMWTIFAGASIYLH
jgi:hypothetical protein